MLFVKRPGSDSFQSKASKQLGYDKLSEAEKLIADSMSINEQKADKALDWGIWAWNLSVFLLIVVVLTSGSTIIEVAKSVLGVK